jgi:hypothetical protein
MYSRDFAVHIVVTAVRAHRIGGDRHAFDDGMGVKTHDVTVLECSGLTFVGVANDVLVAREGARHERPFQASREASTATTAQDGFLDFADDVFLGHLGFQDALQLRVAATGHIVL